MVDEVCGENNNNYCKMVFEFRKRAGEQEVQKGTSCIKYRFVQVALLNFLIQILFGMRNGLPLAIIAMTTEGTSSNPDVPYYDWQDSSIILSAFYWSYAVLQLFSGYMVKWFGLKRLMCAAVCINSLANVLVPVAAEYAGSGGVIACRVVQGLFQGFLTPCINGMLARWVPSDELSLLTAIVYLGYTVGSILIKLGVGYVSASWWGWPVAFYIPGALGFVWCVFWLIFSAETPASHPYISTQECSYIERSLGQENEEVQLAQKSSIPWRAIFRSMPYWAIIVAAVGESWSSTYFQTQMPSFLTYAIGFSIQASGLISAGSVLALMIGGLTFGAISSYTLKKGWISIANTRRTFQGITMYLQILFMMLMTVTDSPVAVTAYYVLWCAIGGGTMLGHMVNPVDLSPKYAVALTGISNGIGQLIAILAPLLVQYMVTDNTNVSQWRSTFILGSVIAFVTTTFYIVYCSAEKQWWDGARKEDGDVEMKKDEGKI